MIGKIKSFIVFLSCLLAGVCLFNACSKFTQSGMGSLYIYLPVASEMSGARLAAKDVNSYTIRLVDSTGAEVKSETVSGGGNHTFYELSPGDYTVAVEARRISENSSSLIGAGESLVAVEAGETASANVVLQYYGDAVLSVYYKDALLPCVGDISILKVGETAPAVIEGAKLPDGSNTLSRLRASPKGIEYTFTVVAKYTLDDVKLDISGSATAAVVCGDTAMVRIDLKEKEVPVTKPTEVLDGINITVPNTADIEMEYSVKEDEQKIIFEVKGDYSSIYWYVDDEAVQSDAENGKSYIFDYAGFDSGAYTVMVVAIGNDSNSYSVSYAVRVQKK